MKKETESGEDEIKPKLRRKPTELDSDDDEDTVDDVKPLKQVCNEMTDSFKFNCWKSYYFPITRTFQYLLNYWITGGKS